MHYIITGGAGFIGSYLMRRLLAAGHRLSVVDDLSSGKRENLPEGVEFIQADITTPGSLGTLLDTADGCFHLAAIVSVQRSQEEWLRTHQVNLGGTVALLDALRRSQRKVPFVFASTAAVYGTAQPPHTEQAVCVPLSAYGADKLACECNSRLTSELYHIPTIGLRLFNVYGPGQDASSPYSGVISLF
ncbi:MAG: NAD-dependent epimerase/dehydratase family protein, partial [Rickettsiales bacterium]|nr:NAD-dependent epimerase/dehydratase family protein [Rickettsiales bacterium]